MKKYDNYKNSGVEWLGEIPENWGTLPIRAIFEERNEKNDGPKTDFILSVTKDRGVIPYDEKGAIGNNKSEDIERYKVVYEGDFVINKMNVVIGSLGMSKYFGAFSQVYLVYKPKSSKININYYSYIFSNPSFYKSLIRYCTGIMELRESLNKEDFKKIILPFPDYNIQTEIVKFLDDKTTKINQAIAIKEKQIVLLKERRQILIHKAVTRGLNDKVKFKDSGVEWIGKIPEHWEVDRLKNYIQDLESGVSVNASESESAIDNEIGVLKTSAVYNYIFEHQENKKVFKSDLRRVNCPVKSNTIIISRMNAPELVGASGYVEKNYPNLFLPDRLWQTVFKKEALVNPKWLSKVIITKGFRNCITAVANGSSPSMKNISKGDFLNLKVASPPIKEQEQIVEFIETDNTKIATAISLKEQEIEKLKEYKMSLINGVVTGKVKVC